MPHTHTHTQRRGVGRDAETIVTVVNKPSKTNAQGQDRFHQRLGFKLDMGTSDGKSSKKGTPNKRWEEDMTIELISFLVEMVKSGSKPYQCFKKSQMCEAADHVNAKFPRAKMSWINVDSRLRTLKGWHKEIKGVFQLSGAGWDENAKMITLEEPVASAYLEAHKSAKQFVNKPLPYWEDLQLIMGDDAPTGHGAKSVHDEISKAGNEKGSCASLDDVMIDCTLGSDDIDGASESSRSSMKRAAVGTSSAFKPRRRRNQNDDKIVHGEAGYVLEDVPHLTDYLPDLPTYPNPLQDNPAYSVVKQYFVNLDDTVAQKIVVHKTSPRGTHFRRAGPRQKVYFDADEVHVCIVTCGGLCPGLNTVIREVVCGLSHMYGVTKILGIEGGYRGFYARNTITLTPKVVNDIHKRGGTILGTSRGGHDTSKIVDSIQDRGINQVYIIGGDGTQKGASVIFEEIQKRGLKVAVVGIPKTIDNDIAVIDKSFGFDTAVEEAQRAINAAHVEAESVENGIGVVKLMGRYSGFIAMYATLASRDVDCCLIPESPFYLEGKGGLFEFIEKRLKENGHMVLVVAEGAGQELIAESMKSMDHQDASGNKLLLDVGLWLSQKIKDHFTSRPRMVINLKYIDPTYMIRAIPSNASDNVYCTLLAHSAIHGAMAGYTGFTVGPVNGRHAYIPFYRVTETQNKVVITDRMWARLLSSTNQPSFLSSKVVEEANKEEPATQLLDGENCLDEDHHVGSVDNNSLSNNSIS